jgi:hypothetical protein
MNMPSLVTVSNIVGTTPYEIYLSVSGSDAYYYIDSISSVQLPYNFTVPIPLQNNQSFCLRVVDNDGCIITNCFNVT